ncbi:membrane dipeptidase [uncultured Meiothermus sp.]|uniref:dipeptidase n=1 Tax=uncultured Meiothermus sp. TaxID=157471 RepID=UPI0026245F5D|nr:membrane dipeptidase [uncultured Meiothermus sp.]
MQAKEGPVRVSIDGMIVDAHLDLAHNAVDLGRDLTLPLMELRKRDSHTDVPVVTLPALREGKIGVCFATLWTDPRKYTDPASAHTQALKQLEVYLRWEEKGLVRILRDKASLQMHLARWPEDRITALVILIEGAECIREPAEVAFWQGQGVRLIGPAWNRTRYCGGTREPGGLSEPGIELMLAMRQHQLALDFAHMDEQAFWQALEIFDGAVCGTHCNPRALLGGEGLEFSNRHLSDAMILAIGQRGGVIGTVLFGFFLEHTWKRGMERVNLEVVGQHMAHTASLIGWDKIGIGSDFDGGFGMHENPRGLNQPGDLQKIAHLVPKPFQSDVLGDNWLRWLQAALP